LSLNHGVGGIDQKTDRFNARHISCSSSRRFAAARSGAGRGQGRA
jgi:hypothetical protein